MHSKTLIGALALILMIPVVSSAALFSASFANLYDTDEIVLAITPDQESRNITFESVDFPGEFNPAAGWSVTSTEPGLVTMGGNAISAGSSLFDVTFNDNTGWLEGWIGTIFNGGNVNWAFDFTLQWTEYLAGVEIGQWTYEFENGVNQSTTPVPLPTSGWMLLSGLALFIGIRRHSSG